MDHYRFHMVPSCVIDASFGTSKLPCNWTVHVCLFEKWVIVMSILHLCCEEMSKLLKNPLKSKETKKKKKPERLLRSKQQEIWRTEMPLFLFLKLVSDTKVHELQSLHFSLLTYLHMGMCMGLYAILLILK